MQGSFVLQTYRRKKQQQIRKAKFRKNGLRFFVVLLACIVVFGCQYCFDTPSALQTNIKANYKKQQGQTLTQAKFNLLYSLYAFPNVVFPLIGGMLIDKVGARIVMVITATICVIGHSIFSFGGIQNALSIMLIGRVVFGIGGQVLHAAQNTLISGWFKASQLSMALGICISFPKMGSSLNAVLTTSVANSVQADDPESFMNVGYPLLIALGLMILSLVVAVILAIIDRKSQKQERIKHESTLLANQKQPLKKKKQGSEQIKSVEVSVTSSVGKYGLKSNTQATGNEHFSIAAIKNLPITFWLLMLIAMLSEALFIPFLQNGNQYYQKIFIGINTTQQAGIYLILPYVVSSILVPIMGYVVDKVGRRSIVLIISTGFILLTFCFMIYLQTSVQMRELQWLRWVPTGLLGVCIAIFCTVIVPTVPMLVKPSLLGSGLGIMQVVQNLALGIFPLLAGTIRQSEPDNHLKGFHFQTLFFFIMACVCFSASIWLKVADVLTGGRLDVKDFRKEYVNKVLRQD